jgi:protein subunit release factor B
MGIENQREKLFSLSIKDKEFDVRTFHCGGPGGQNVNKVASGVRIVHKPSGAIAECRETRDQLENKRRAFVKLVKSGPFKVWLNRMIAIAQGQKSPEEVVDEQMATENLMIEVKNDNGQWITKEDN